MYSFWRYLLLLIFVWTGCSTSQKAIPRKVAPVQPSFETEMNATPQPIRTNLTTKVVIPPAPATNHVVLPAQNNNIVRPNPSHPATPPLPAWVDVKHWSAETKKATLRQTGLGFYPSYRLESPRGVLDFTIKSQIARWNGTVLKFSFAPQSDHGKPFIHGLDLEKSVIPLLENSHCELKNKIVVIDPGHGGLRLGTKSVSNNHFEKEYTLDWALRVQSLLTNEGWKVILTRTNDVDIPLTNRVEIADNANAGLFISLHFNSFNKDQTGLETYCLTPAGMPSNLVRGPEDELPQSNNTFDNQNLCWAMRLHRQLLNGTHSVDGGVQRARFPAVLKSQKRPAVLIEGGYLSNRKESALIASPAYRQQMAEALVKAILKQ